MCHFVGYKCGGGGYRVWDPVRHSVLEARDVIFFEDGLPQATFHGSTMPASGGDDMLVHDSPPLTATSLALSAAPTLAAWWRLAD